MAGSNSAFDPTAFRTAIRFAMNMGAPQNVTDRATFRWPEVKTYVVHDPANRPYQWSETPLTDTQHADVQIPVAVKSSTVSPEQTDIGTFNQDKVVITILDEDYAKVQGATVILIGQVEYDIESVGPPEGLFEVTVYELIARAKDTKSS